MNSQMAAEQAGAQAANAFVMGLFVVLPFWFLLVKGLPEQKRSLRLANLALGCGLFAFFRPERLRWAAAFREQALLGTRLVLVLVAVGGVVLAVRALRARASDEATGHAKSVIAMLLCFLLAYTSGGMIVMSHALSPENDTSWEWRSAKHGYRLRVPSSGCAAGRATDADAAFECRLRRMHAVVYAKPADEAAYAAEIESVRSRVRQSKDRQEEPVIEQTHTEAGWPCARATMVERARDGRGPILVSIALVRWPEKGMVFTVVFEGEIWSASEAATQVVREALVRDAQALHVSLGPAPL